MKGDREWLIEKSFDAYLEKPIRYNEFLASVTALLRLVFRAKRRPHQRREPPAKAFRDDRVGSAAAQQRAHENVGIDDDAHRRMIAYVQSCVQPGAIPLASTIQLTALAMKGDREVKR